MNASTPDFLAAALATLPHGPEFRFVDRLLHLEPGRKAEGEYRLRGDEGFLRGHFPGAPLLPGVLLVEAMAQLGGIAAQTDPGIPPLPGLKLAAIRGMKISASAIPGETVRLRAEVTARLAGLIQCRGTAEIDGRVIAQGEITLAGG